MKRERGEHLKSGFSLISSRYNSLAETINRKTVLLVFILTLLCSASTCVAYISTETENSDSSHFSVKKVDCSDLSTPSVKEVEEVVVISNGILEVVVEGSLGFGGVGTYTIRTGPSHSNPGQDVFYGGSAANPWTTYNTIHVVDTATQYTSISYECIPDPGYTCLPLDNMSPVVDFSSTMVTTSWQTLEDLLVVQEIEVMGTTEKDTKIRITMKTTNNDVVAHNVGVRYEWDIMVDGWDGSWMRTWTSGTPSSWLNTEQEWVSPTHDYWETTNYPLNPLFYIFGSISSPADSTPPDKTIFAHWASSIYAYSYAPSSRVIGGTVPSSGGEYDSAVLYYWNPTYLSPGESRTVTASIFSVRAERSPDEILIEEVIQPENVTHDIVALKLLEPLRPGDVIKPAMHASPYKEYQISNVTWFYWIDDCPYAMFAHDTRYVFIDEAGDYVVEREEWWPLLNDEELWASPEEYWNKDNWVYSTFTGDLPAAYVDPLTTTIPVSEDFTVDINIEDVIGLYAWQAWLRWDPNLLDVVDVTEGDFLKASGPTLWSCVTNQSEGWIFVYSYLEPGYPVVSGGGTLANVTFHGIKHGECVLDLYNTRLFNSTEYVSTPPYLGDANGDLVVNIVDVATVGGAIATSAGDPRYDPDADFNEDGFVDLFDLLCAHLNWMCEYPESDARRPVETAHEVNDGYSTISSTTVYDNPLFSQVESNVCAYPADNSLFQFRRRSLIIEGPDKKSYFARNTAENLRNLLIENFGHSDDEIIYLRPDKDVDYVDGNSTVTNVNKTLEDLSQTSSIDDDLWIFIVAHGYSDQQCNGYVLLQEKELTDKELAQLLGQINASITVVIESCYSGSFIDDLCKVPQIKIVVTSTDWKSICYKASDGLDPPRDWENVENMRDPNPEDEGGEFSSGFIIGLEELTPAFNGGQITQGELYARAYKTAKEKDAGYLYRNVLIAIIRNESKYGPYPLLKNKIFVGDSNADGVVDIFDVVIVAIAFGSELGHTNWNPVADVDCNAVVNIFDVVTMAINFAIRYF